MEDHWRELLEQHDDPKYWEYPGGIPRHAQAGSDLRFQQFVKLLEDSLGKTWPIETGIQIQDASFHSQILFDAPDTHSGGLRFSNFGNMIAFTPDHELPTSLKEAVVAVAEQLGYVLVPSDVLEEDYTGRNPGVSGIATWWIRYFDWV